MPFPTALPSYATILSNTEMDDSGFEHDVMHNAINDDVEAIGAKIGIGASTPVSSQVLRGTGTGTSGWGQVQTGDIATDAVTVRAGRSAGTTDPVTTNTTTAALANPTLSITVPTGVTMDILVWASATINDGNGLTIVEYWVRLDGGSWNTVGHIAVPAASGRYALAGFHRFAGVAAGAHTIEIGNSSNNGSASITHYGASRSLMALGIAK